MHHAHYIMEMQTTWSDGMTGVILILPCECAQLLNMLNYAFGTVANCLKFISNFFWKLFC